MCINPVNAQLEQQMGVLMFSVISKVIEASLSAEQPTTTDVLASATSAYQQGHITKAQYFAVINALDETTMATDPNYDYIKCHNLLNQYRR